MCSAMLLAWNHRQEYMRGMGAVMQNRLGGSLHLRVSPNRVAGVLVAVPAREIAAGHVQADAMPRFEQVARRPQINRVLIGFARLQQFWLGQAPAIARPDNAISQVL